MGRCRGMRIKVGDMQKSEVILKGGGGFRLTGLLVHGVANSVDSFCSTQRLRRMKLAPSPECDNDFETALGFEIKLAIYMI